MDPEPSPLRHWFGTACFLLFSSLALMAADRPDNNAVVPPVSNSVVLPFELRRGHIMISASINESNSLPFMIDTGFGVSMLRSGLAEELGLRRAGRITIVGIAGEKEAGMFAGPRFDFDGLKWSPRRVAAFPAADSPRSHSRNGILGSGFFKRFVVVIDSHAKKLALHEPATFDYQGTGEILPLKFKDTTPIVEASCLCKDGTVVPAQFEIDTGCDSSLCVGREFGTAQGLVSTNAPAEERSGLGNDTRTRPGHLAQFRLGQVTVANVRAEVFLDGSPVEAPSAGHIGWELLRRYRVIFDYSRSRMILEPGAPR